MTEKEVKSSAKAAVKVGEKPMPKKRKQNANLHPIKDPKEAKEKGKKGGVKSGEIRLLKKSVTESLKLLLDEETKNKDGQSVSNGYLEIAAAIKKGAVKGNMDKIGLVIDLMGERPESKVALSSDISLTVVSEELKDYAD